MQIFIANVRMGTSVVADQERASYESAGMACVGDDSVMHNSYGMV